MSARTKASRIVAWIGAIAIGAAAVGAYLHVRSGDPRRAAGPPMSAPVAPQPASTPATPPPASSAPAAIPFAPRIYPSTAAVPAPGAAPSPIASAGAGPANGASVPGEASAAPLPAGTPVRAVLQRLRAAADAGDASAACRVGLEMLRCASRPAVVSATTRGMQEMQAGCEGVSPQDAQQGWSYVERAAGAGSAVAQRVAQSRSWSGVSPAQCGR